MPSRSPAVAVAVAVAAVTVAALAVAGPLAAPAAANAAVPAAPAVTAQVVPGALPPDQDPFYAAPADLAGYQPGQLVAARPLPNPSLDWIPLPVDAWQLSYRTDDAHGRPELAVTTLVVPKSAWTGGGSRPVVSLESPEDSLGTQCAPSYQIATGRDNEDAALGATLIASNWALVLPDHEGPKSEFLDGPEEGHAVLDGIRAVKSFGADGIGAGNRYALSGYSGGANAAAWAAELQPSYAPDVPLAGAAIGGTPADPVAVGRHLDGTAAAGLEFAAAYGIATEWPTESGIDGLLTPAGRADFDSLGGQCLTTLALTHPFRTLGSDTSAADPLGVPSVAAVLRTDTLGAQAPATPVYDYHADTDEIVPVGQDDTLVDTWCGEGGQVVKVRDLLGEHGEEAAVREVAVQHFLADRFAGEPVDGSC
ncbi:lipase family protein [Kitasatospora sp. LaBMicrA B282]|uniref:lipase family protein n=1 Tax=Kitasatospora sp. LaBMicrA B282 TaxID=3420949 RepID=UPI003D121A3A